MSQMKRRKSIKQVLASIQGAGIAVGKIKVSPDGSVEVTPANMNEPAQLADTSGPNEWDAA